MKNQLLAILPMVLIFVVFYFLLIRPQNKKQKERVQMLSLLKKGDKVVTIGGLHGSIVDLNDERVTLKVNDHTRLTFERSAINSILRDPAKVEEKKAEEKEKKQEKPTEVKEINNSQEKTEEKKTEQAESSTEEVVKEETDKETAEKS
ncbi:preprotein translocase, YajC subunit [Seinonella peptonophila]|uniref:Preprotein translocase, YajC subunit n=1 Tax=Seinonella peptonophila TaxID=112248 RepID=A0A1M4TR98_9BACL|nr:preprotein translocase, YajC subunit [Seinonella peptonophila]